MMSSFVHHDIAFNHVKLSDSKLARIARCISTSSVASSLSIIVLNIIRFSVDMPRPGDGSSNNGPFEEVHPIVHGVGPEKVDLYSNHLLLSTYL